MSDDLSGRIAIVTGGGWNIGRAIAIGYAAAGARVVVASRNRERLDATVAEITAAGGEAMAVPTDVTDAAQLESLVATTVTRFGTVDVFAAIAGGGAVDAPIDELDPDDWERVVRVNLSSAFHSARAVVPVFRQHDRGTLILCAGGGAFFPVLGTNISAYACAKAAVCRLTDQLTAELYATAIRVHCIDPGMVWSPSALLEIERHERCSGEPHPLRAHNHAPEDAAELALWLASDASAPLRGRLISVDDAWWRDPERVRAVHDSIHSYRLRRDES